ncbi:WDR24 family WD repeat protein [Schizosaccharomyces cryophilus OY26]|uniref:Restriction of telomere capping protein 1 n=1 Tax=Schizosaccharomyces cryophilus (strain OY26 / ATCC MYA-4695 / CBS 11777 / NBRC 106824 / NRRL Y48691) TaxID=653667 RepID=S9XFM6_SCHCR|nr:WDR24 family WD repeat protein [Schizosaccharomyces cryophilus OY26]EPY52441.1 WDR24 family WD repeat protein [Schizosaccharomyces cryophilus OY26]
MVSRNLLIIALMSKSYLSSRPAISYSKVAATYSSRAQKNLSEYQDWAFQTQGSVNSLSPSPDFTKFAIAGRELLEILALNANPVRPPIRIKNFSSGNAQEKNTSCNDVKWGNDFSENYLFTCSPLGDLNVWDIDLGQNISKFTEHSRAIHSIDVSKFHSSYVLTASQDGLTKLWDFRESHSTQTFKGNSEAARDVVFSPSESNEFVVAYDNGTVQKWDLRYSKSPSLKLSAHNGVALCIDYTPNGSLLASCGRDKSIRIWDINNNQRKAISTINTIAPVNLVRWEPAEVNNATCRLASSSLLGDNSINVWDIRRPYVPHRSLNHHENNVTALQWISPNVLLSSSRDGVLSQSRVNDAKSYIDIMPSSAVSWSTNGSITFSSNNLKNPNLRPPVNRTSSRESNISSLKTALQAKQPIQETHLKQTPANFEFSYPVKNHQLAITSIFPNTSHQFVQLAKSYQLSGETNTACQRNARLAYQLGAYEAQAMWDFLFFSSLNLNHKERFLAKDDYDFPFSDESRSVSTQNKSERSRRSSFESEGLSDDYFESLLSSSSLSSSILSVDYEDNLDKAVSKSINQRSDHPTSMRSRKDGNPPFQGGRGSITSLHFFDSIGSNVSAHSQYDMSNSLHQGSVTSASIKSRDPAFSLGSLSRRTSYFHDQLSLVAEDAPPTDLVDVVTSSIIQCIDESDVQTGASVYLLFSALPINIPRPQLDDLIDSYVGLLRRMGMFCEAAYIVKHSSQVVKYKYSANRDLSFGHKSNPKPYRQNVSFDGVNIYSKLERCCFCELPLNGVITSCYGCGHLGHESCLREWFFNDSTEECLICPVPGCGQVCF